MALEDSGLPCPATASPVETPTGDGSASASTAFLRWMGWVVAMLPFGYLWFRLINNLRLEWGTNPQYSYGWVVPMLCLVLFVRRCLAMPEEIQVQKSQAADPSTSGRRLAKFIFISLAFLYMPTLLIEKSTPEWRPVEWALCLEAIGLTLCAIYLDKGRSWLRRAAFPICFFLVAVPWPTLIEQPVIQSLSRMNSAIAVEVVGLEGIPAIQHGNVIEVRTGSVGVNEACSGIRSFQTSLMLSLFFGEFFGLSLMRRLLLIPAGSVAAMAFNVCRVSFLTTVAARKGISAIAEYHDPAGIMITLVCTAVLWGFAVLFKRSQPPSQSCQPPLATSEQEVPKLNRDSSFRRLGFALLLWLIVADVGTELWYRALESHLVPSPEWSIMFPKDDPTLKTLPITADTAYLLRYDDAKQASWTDLDGSRWQAFYCDWRPGRVAGYLAKRHTPEICLPATGWNLISGPNLTMMNIKGVELPVRDYVWGAEGSKVYVFHCRWEAGAGKDAYVTHESARFNLIRGIWAGRGNHGQKVLEFFVTGCSDAAQAKAAFVRHLEKMIKVEKSSFS